MTQLRLLFINDIIDPKNALGGGNFQAIAAQADLALSDRLSVIADKDGYAWINPGAVPSSHGFLNIAAGLKYALIRDVENQFIVSGGFMYEPPTGQGEVFQGSGDGTLTFFVCGGKEFQERTHLLGTVGYQVPLDANANSSFYYTSLHVDYQLLPRLYPLVEMNWFHYVAGGEHGLPASVGEGDGLINLGTSGVAGNDLVTLAIGARRNWVNTLTSERLGSSRSRTVMIC